LKATVVHAHETAVPDCDHVGEAGVLADGAKLSANPNPTVAEPGVAEAVFSSAKLLGVPSDRVFPEPIAAKLMTLALEAFVVRSVPGVMVEAAPAIPCRTFAVADAGLGG